MKRLIQPVIYVCALFIIAFGVFPRQAMGGVPVLGCILTIEKEAFPPDGQLFDFVADYSTGPDQDFSIFPGDESDVEIGIGQSVVVSEIVPVGWELLDVECESEGGIGVVVDDANNVLADCATTGFAFCTFTNRGPANVPTLSEWGMIAAAAGLGLVGVFFAVRRRKAAL